MNMTINQIKIKTMSKRENLKPEVREAKIMHELMMIPYYAQFNVSISLYVKGVDNDFWKAAETNGTITRISRGIYMLNEQVSPELIRRIDNVRRKMKNPPKDDTHPQLPIGTEPTTPRPTWDEYLAEQFSRLMDEYSKRFGL